MRYKKNQRRMPELFPAMLRSARLSYSCFQSVKPRQKHTAWSAGYTIIEVLIFLAITGAMFTIASTAFSGQQAKAEFNTSIRDVDSKLQDVINNVSSGLYRNNGRIQCDLLGPGGRLRLTETTTGQGTNAPCIYIGQFLHFAPHSAPGQLNIYSVAGRRVDSSGREVTHIAMATPLVIANGTGPPNNNPGPDTTDVYAMPYGLRITKASYDNGGGLQPTGAVGFFTTFNKYSGNNLESGSTITDVIILTGPSPGLNTQKDSMVNAINNALNTGAMGNYIRNPVNGVKVCMESNASEQVAVMTISGQRTITTDYQIYNKRSDAPGGVCP